MRKSSVLSLLAMCSFGGAACAGDGKHAHGGASGDDESAEDGSAFPEDSGSLDDDASALDDASVADAGEQPMVSACTVCTNCEHAVTLPATANHVEGEIAYTDLPPAGGNHNYCWLNFGVYEQEKPDERWVHNLEHGGVVFLYRCPTGCAAEVAELKRLTKGKAQVLLTPYAALPTKFAAVSWGYRLLTECFNSKQFASFYTTHVDHGPESIKEGPPAAYCPP